MDISEIVKENPAEPLVRFTDPNQPLFFPCEECGVNTPKMTVCLCLSCLEHMLKIGREAKERDRQLEKLLTKPVVNGMEPSVENGPFGGFLAQMKSQLEEQKQKEKQQEEEAVRQGAVLVKPGKEEVINNVMSSIPKMLNDMMKMMAPKIQGGPAPAPPVVPAEPAPPPLIHPGRMKDIIEETGNMPAECKQQ